MSRSKKKDPVVPEAASARPSLGPRVPSFAGISKGRTVGFTSSNNSGPPMTTPAPALPSVAVAAAARTPAAPQGPEVAPTTPTDDVLKPVAPPPQAPAAPPAQPAATAPSSPPAGGFSATSHAWAVPGAADARTDATNAWQDRVDQRSEYQRRRLNEQIPQGETRLVHVWFSVVAQGVPPQACSIWLTRTEPAEHTYEMMVPGEAVSGPQPDRSLFAYMMRNRRQAGVAETFTGRIRAPTTDGKVIELGGGMLSLPPDPALAQQQAPPGMGPWMMPPGAAWTPPNGQQAMGPWGTPPWMGGGQMPPWMMGMPPWMMGMMPWMQQGGAPPWWQQQQPPKALEGKPDLIELWKLMNQSAQQGSSGQQQLLDKLLEVALRDKTPEKAPGLKEQLEGFAAIATSIDAIRGPREEGAGKGISVTYVDDGAGGRTPIVTGTDGKIDMSTTVGIPVVGALRSVGSKIGARIGGGAPGNIQKGKSPQPAQVPASTNGAGTKQ
jgi:hypothetical protein